MHTRRHPREIRGLDHYDEQAKPHGHRYVQYHSSMTWWYGIKRQGSRAVGDKLTSIVHKMHPLIAMRICIARSRLPKDAGSHLPRNRKIMRRYDNAGSPLNYQKEKRVEKRYKKNDHTTRKIAVTREDCTQAGSSLLFPPPSEPCNSSQSEEISKCLVWGKKGAK